MKRDAIHSLRGPILRSVSRSFYLSIRLLPTKLRDPIALAYLLARATDTIADTAEISAAVRTAELAKLAASIQGTTPSSPDSLEGFAALQKDEAERALIVAVPDCLRWLASLSESDRADVRDVLAKISEGQTLDVQRFADPGQVAALQTAADLDRYTYLVAGAVGEFWTRVCFRHLPRFSTQPEERMCSWSIEYGKGLQLINILRDLGADLRAGRCYLPADELAASGTSPAEILSAPRGAEPVLRYWEKRAEAGIAAGIEYSCAIKPVRLRFATVLPALLGARTLALLRHAGSSTVERKIKIKRAEVKRIMLQMAFSLTSPAAIRKAHQQLSR